VDGSCEHSNEASGSINCWDTLWYASCYVSYDIYNGIVYTKIVLKETDTTVSTFVLLAVDGNATCFDPFLGSSSGVQECWY
jgi:hypothetical protein